MKWLLYILSLYILVLSCIPCNDADAAVRSGIEQTARLTTPHEHDIQPDFCSPLCVCSCCNVHVTPGAAIIVLFYHHRVRISYPLLPVNPLPSLSAIIWQPPQLV
ncbi:DUF6660 family protein [Chitinophaga niastensis]|uniref:DUF6660 family protein n=1 Tax=Chitinophaga niastensis TaxID=536980 RepID=UPI0011B26192|nr:DUF6660 family protein [Chitinophaga niastensis]